MEEIIEMVIAMLIDVYKQDVEVSLEDVARQLLSIETPTHRLAVVEKEGELPKNPYPESVFPELDSDTSECEASRARQLLGDRLMTRLHGSWGRHVVNFTQQDMLKDHWVKEVTDAE